MRKYKTISGMQAKATDEAGLAAAVKNGDGAAFETIYKRYAPALMHYSKMIVKDTDSAYEVVQDTFVSVWLNRSRIDASKPLSNYLLRSVHNNSLRLVKKEAARHLRERRCAPDDAVITPQEQETPSYDMESLIPAVDRLPEQSRKVFRMSYWEDMKNMDIAAELSISIRTVEAILYKARKRLRDELRKL